MAHQKKDNQVYYNPLRRAILNHQMIEPGDRVAVGLSGGKDSTTLFYLLDRIAKERRLGFEFELVPITLDMDMGMDISPLTDFIEKLGYELTVVPTNIATVVFDIRQEKSPCSLCAKLRRGILNQSAKDLGCNKMALGHHGDDAIETYLMNFLFHGKLASFAPVTYLSKVDITLIRPLLYLEETTIKTFVAREDLPVIFNPCPVDKKTKREEIKKVVTQLSDSYPLIRQRFIQGMEQGTAENFWQSSLPKVSDDKGFD
ncbi:ATP-binding protein [uncultured Vagococcus sp.]|uniref:tRNA 2-thiocytidine biosynthesis TtcA family protein n=1 Tax=uncultured Vagococcus sp. TaxID=189676 RepID=UPI0028D82C94|nr:ATP-binding protein [uncultured Vagococcus sp.]